MSGLYMALISTDLPLVLPTNAIQIQEHVQVTSQFSEAVHSGAKRPDDAFWEIGSSDVSEQRTDQEA